MIIRIELFKFKARQGRVALSHLREHAALVARFKGCLEARVARSPEDPEQYLVYSRWDSQESHGSMALQLRRSQEAQRALLALASLLEGEGKMAHFEVLEG
ncbi:MAG TPA: antibiotic biosynthesis monooxygenase family protein [Dehalococcoidia bacterium]|nr:antibiotic biosynthesis monooxygenase family protein [Dehalococcoidia bacterium]